MLPHEFMDLLNLENQDLQVHQNFEAIRGGLVGVYGGVSLNYTSRWIK